MHPLQKLLEELDYDCKSYSGRGMYGKYCLGVEVTNTNNMISSVIRNIIFDKEEIADAFESMKTDSMGKENTIVYFTNVEYTSNDDDDDEDDS